MKSSAAQVLDAPPVAQRPPLPGPTGLRASLRALRAMRTDLLGYLRELDAAYSGPDMTPVAFSLLGQPMYLITDPVQIKEMLSNYEIFTRNVKNLRAFRVALGQNIITVPDHEWPSVRKRTANYFTNELLEHYGNVVVEVLDKHAIPRLTQKAQRGELVDLFDEMLGIASLAAFISFLGGNLEDHPREVYTALSDVFSYVRRNSFSLVVLPRWVPTAENRELSRNLNVLREYLRPRLESDRERETMMGDLIRTHTDADGKRDDQRILDEIIANLVGGSETTIVLMTYAMFYLVQTPETEAKLRAEIEGVLGTRPPTVQDLKSLPYLLQTVQESLRLRSPGYINYRYVTRDAELGGYPIKKGSWTVASQYITHQDARVWRDPHAFRPERFAKDSPEAPNNRRREMPFFPFGGGIFFCIGKNYAINEAALMLVMLLQNFRFFAPDGGRSLSDPGIDARLTLRPGRPIQMRVELAHKA
jgi:cytochrome P450